MSRNDRAFAGPKLPRSLLDQVDNGTSSNARRRQQNGSKWQPPSRRDKRKNEREEKKSRIYNPVQKRQKREPVVEDDSSASEDEPTPPPSSRKLSEKAARNGAARPKSILKPTKDPAPPVSKKTKERLDADDAEIAGLEKKLGLKTKKLSKSFHDDGLVDLLEGLDESGSDGQERIKRKGTQDNEWLKNKRRKTTTDEDEDTSEDEDEFDMNSDDEDELDMNGLDSDMDKEPPPKRKKENPYIAPPTTETPAKYVPPSRRAPPSDDAELNQRLRRQTQGLLNRLSDANLISIVNDMEKLFQSNPRQYVTATLVDLLLALMCDRTTLNDTFIILHAGFISAMYKVLGPDFGAQMLEGIVRKVDQFYAESTADGTTGKETANLISLLAQLFNFGVISSDILFDYIRIFLSSLTEFHTELLLRVVRTSGTQLRQDDPLSHKDIVLLLQKTVAATNEGQVSVRTQFMIETINDLKNNRLKTGVAGSTVASEHSTRMRKTLGSLNTRGTIKASEPLRIPLDDVRNADKKGKWWLVGASWKGNSTAASQSQPPPNDQPNASDSDTDILTTATPHDLPTLAHRNGMNNPLRRSIFAAVVSASDYRDAHTRLLKLHLSRAQGREIPRVLVHCAAAEPRYNPYYALIARRLCADGDRKIRVAFQFALWDLFKRIGAGDDGTGIDDDGDGGEVEVSMRALVHYAKFYGALVAAGGLGIGVLKTMDVAALALTRGNGGAGGSSKAATFLEVLLITVLAQAAKASDKSRGEHKGAGSARVQPRNLGLRGVFAPALELPALATGLRAFVKRVVRRSDLVSGEKEKRRVRKGCELVAEVLGSASDEPPMEALGMESDGDGDDLEVEWDGDE